MNSKRLKSVRSKVGANFAPENREIFCYVLSLMIIGLFCFVPEIALASSLEQQLTKVNAQMSNVKLWGISGASILVLIVSIFRGNVKIAGIAVSIGVIASLYLQWIDGGMKIG